MTLLDFRSKVLKVQSPFRTSCRNYRAHDDDRVRVVYISRVSMLKFYHYYTWSIISHLIKVELPCHELISEAR